MSDNGTSAPGATSPVPPTTTVAGPLDQGHIEGTGGLPRGSRTRASRRTCTAWPTSTRRPPAGPRSRSRRCSGSPSSATLLFIVAYFAIPQNRFVYVPGIGRGGLSNLALGVDAGRSACCASALGAVHWAKTLMPDEEVVELRHPQRSADDDRQAAVDGVYAGGEAAQLGRRPLIKYTLGGALGLFAIPLVLQMVGGLGPLPGNALSTTMWRKGLRLMTDPEMLPIKASDVTIGSVFHVMPEGIDKQPDILEQKAKAAVLLMRLDPERPQGRQGPRLGLPGHRGLLQDLHPRRLPGRAVRAADAPPALPVPPVDLRRDAGLQGDLRPGQAAAAAAADHRGQ